MGVQVPSPAPNIVYKALNFKGFYIFTLKNYRQSNFNKYEFFYSIIYDKII